MEIKFSDAALNKIKPKLDDHTTLLISYEDGVGPYANHNPGAMQIQFDLVLINDDMDKSLYQEHYDSVLGPIYYKDYSKEYLDDNLRVEFNTNFNTFNLFDDSEKLEDNFQIFDYRKK